MQVDDTGNDHAESAEEDAKQPQSELVGNDASTETNPSRRRKIEAVLSHRKLLLQRLRQARQASRTRLASAIKGDPASASQSDDQEIAAFREMGRQATSLARKQASSVAEVGEKRTSVSLRKGSSVGKRMNAALSSLAPGIQTANEIQAVPRQSSTSTHRPSLHGSGAVSSMDHMIVQNRAGQKRPHSQAAVMTPSSLLDSPTMQPKFKSPKAHRGLE